jgi:hypothetical protein
MVLKYRTYKCNNPHCPIYIIQVYEDIFVKGMVCPKCDIPMRLKNEDSFCVVQDD